MAGGGLVARDSEEKKADSEKERKQRLSESEMSREGDARVFWKMVYGKNFRKPFSLFSSAIFRSISVGFLLTSVLQHPKRPKMLKTFYFQTNGVFSLIGKILGSDWYVSSFSVLVS
jgi:hypothetical protein